jgi:hypothetical protein
VRLTLLALTTTLVFILPGCSTLPKATNAAGEREAPRRIDVAAEALQRSVHVEVLLNGNVISSGHGVVVRPGLVATAVHVVDRVPNHAELRVRNLFGQALATPSAGGHRDQLDGALLHVFNPEQLGLPASLTSARLCEYPIQSGQSLLVVTGNAATPTHGSPDHVAYAAGRPNGTDRITHALPPGASGSGVYDAESGCLAGVVSQRRRVDSTVGTSTPQLHTTRLTPAADIRLLLQRLEAGQSPQ